MRLSLLRVLAPLAVLASIVLASVGASAQPADPPPAEPPPAATGALPTPPAPPADADAAKKEEAKQHFLKGLALSREDNHDAALVEFLASRDIYPTRVAILNAALTLHTLKRYAEALDMYEELTTRFASSLPPEEKKTIEDAMGQLRGVVGEIAIESDQPGTAVVIDAIERGSTPLPKPVRVNAGTHSLRAFKEGFVQFETQVLVGGGQMKSVKVSLRPLARAGKLRVTETSGKEYEVVVDGAVVGKTPWEGSLSVGTHSVLLRGPDQMGTMPSSAEVQDGGTAVLSLTAIKLDATLRVEPTPSNARVDIDGVAVGNGVWEGAVQSGSHRVEVTAPGFIAYRQNATVAVGQREVVTAVLERNPNDPMWADVFRPHVYIEALAGPFFSPSFGGSADEACSGGCDKSLPFGFMAGVRGGYAATSGLGLELFVGYLLAAESMTRTQNAVADAHVISLESTDYEDKTRIAGPMAALSASYSLFEKTPLTMRIWAGAARVKAHFENRGRFNGVSQKEGAGTDQQASFSIDFGVDERDEQIWIPFVGPEVRFGYRINKRFMIDGGVAVFAMFGPATERLGADGKARQSFFDPPGARYPDGTAVPTPGFVSLGGENGFGTFVGIAPTVALRMDF